MYQPVRQLQMRRNFVTMTMLTTTQLRDQITKIKNQDKNYKSQEIFFILKKIMNY